MHSWLTQEWSLAFLQIKPLRDNNRSIDYWISFLRNISSISGKIHFFVSWNNANIKLFLACEPKNLSFVENMFYASYPDSELNLVHNVSLRIQEYLHRDQKKTIIRSFENYQQWGNYKSPFHDLLSVFNTVNVSSTLNLHFIFQFKKESNAFEKAVDFTKWLFLGSAKTTTQDHQAEDKSLTIKEQTPELRGQIGINIVSADPIMKQWIKQQLSLALKAFIERWSFEFKTRKSSEFSLLRSQAANFFHLPTQDHFTKALDYAIYRKLPYPYPLPTRENTSAKEFTRIGKTDYRNDAIEFWMVEEDKFRHMYIVGKTWTGKSTFLSNLISDDIKNWKWVALLDPHGELVETVLEHIPSHRTNDVILFDVADSDFPIWFNLLQAKDRDEKNRIVSGVVTTFQKLFAHSRWPRLEYILRNTLLSLVDYPNATLMHILRILTDDKFRDEVLKHTKDSLISKFWKDEFNKWDERKRQEAIWPITNKIGQFLSSSVVRNIFWQPNSKLDLREAMDNEKIILINLSKGKIWEDNASMIWSLLVTKFQIDAMSRADMRPQDRKPFYLYIDEFQNFATDSFATILSEARKYKLSLVMANQYTTQLSDTVRDAIRGNVGSIFSFTVGYDDATMLSNQFKEAVSVNDLISLPRFTAYTRMMINGVTSDPFSITTIPLPHAIGSQEQTHKIIEQSRQRYALPKVELEKLLDARQSRNFSQTEQISMRATLEGKGIEKNLIDEFFASWAADREIRYSQHHHNSSLPSWKTPTPQQSPSDTTLNKPQFSSNDIVLGEFYEGYIKLQFNYGLFVTVKWVEGLLHKSELHIPQDVDRKKYFTVGDPIRVRAKAFKEIKGEKRIVRSMK